MFPTTNETKRGKGKKKRKKNAAQVNCSDIQCVEYVLRMIDLSGLPYGRFQNRRKKKESEKTYTHTLFVKNT